MNPATGGPCEGIRNLIPELMVYGVISDVVCLDNPDEDFLKSDSFKIYALGRSRTVWKYHPQLLQWLLIYLSKYDIVIIRGLWLYHSYAVYKAMQILKKKKIASLPRVYVMPHGMLDPWFQKVGSRKLKALRNLFYWHLIEKNIINKSQGVLFTCFAELELARQTFSDYKPQQEINIGYGIHRPPQYNDQMYQAFIKKCPIVMNDSFLLFLGRIDEKKGIDLLIESYDLLLSEGCSLPKLVIAGPGRDTRYGDKIIKSVQNSSQLVKYIFFTGMLTGDAKWGAYYNCDAFILPSHQENFGIAVVEAMGCGKAVLISNQINIFQDIEEAGAGLVNSDSEAGVLSLIQSWIEMTTDKKNEISHRAKKLFETRFNISSAARQMIEKLEL